MYKQKEEDTSLNTYKKQDYDKGILLLRELKNNYSLTNLDIKATDGNLWAETLNKLAMPAG